MSETTSRPVSWFSVAAVFIGLGLFLLVVNHYYEPQQSPRPYNIAGEELPEDQLWKATPEGRAAHLAEVQSEQGTAASSYAWIDRAGGVVRLPVDRAMELTAREIQAGPRP